MQRRLILDWAAMSAVLALGGYVVIAPLFGASETSLIIAGALLAATAVAALWNRMASRPDHLRAVQSQRILDIANVSMSYMRQGLTHVTAQEVCRLTLQRTEADAVAITDRDTVLGFAGEGEDHHTVGGPIITRATNEVLE
ncbi:MAG TPA: hypothetical protein VIK38_10660, partial [Coriobacteriia bacterium]